MSHDDDRWARFAEQAECEYCGETGPTMADPFGMRPACRPCWEMIAYGDERDSTTCPHDGTPMRWVEDGWYCPKCKNEFHDVAGEGRGPGR